LKRIIFLALLTLGVSVDLARAQVVRQSVDGIRNLALIETTVACAGAITPESVAEIKAMGFESVINLRLASEPGANVEAEEAAASAVGIRYIHIPFNGGSPEAAVVDRFVEEISRPGAEPAFIHCAGGNRAAAMWFAKRALVDGWETSRAMTEATELGFSSEPLKTFMMEYVETRAR
jgi:uncharacterized protein (TIGR01244 family)